MNPKTTHRKESPMHLTSNRPTLASHARSARRARRAARALRNAGMTLTEIMIVIIIMAMIAAAVGAAVIPKFQDAQRHAAAMDAEAIRSAAESYSLENGARDCPTVDELVEAHELRRGSRTLDPWGTAFKIECAGGEITVKSAGPDHQFGGDDDI